MLLEPDIQMQISFQWHMAYFWCALSLYVGTEILIQHVHTSALIIMMMGRCML